MQNTGTGGTYATTGTGTGTGGYAQTGAEYGETGTEYQTTTKTTTTATTGAATAGAQATCGQEHFTKVEDRPRVVERKVSFLV